MSTTTAPPPACLPRSHRRDGTRPPAPQSPSPINNSGRSGHRGVCARCGPASHRGDDLLAMPEFVNKEGADPMSSLRRNMCHGLGFILSSCLLVTLVLASPAWGHITVHPSTLPAGSSDVEITFRVPNERDNANTVKTQVFFPRNLPLLTVDVLPIPGWSSVVQTQSLAKPIQTDDGPVSQIVTDVTWTATGAGIAPGQYEDFEVAAGSVPDKAAQLVFKALQTYSSGEIVRWIQLATSQDPSPETPAPILSLTSGGTGLATPRTSRSQQVTGSGSTSTADALAIVALVLSAGSIVGFAVLATRGRRKAMPPDLAQR